MAVEDVAYHCSIKIKSMFLLSVIVMEMQMDKIIVKKNKCFLVRTQLCSKFAPVIYQLCDLKQAIPQGLQTLLYLPTPGANRLPQPQSPFRKQGAADVYLTQLL